MSDVHTSSVACHDHELAARARISEAELRGLVAAAGLEFTQAHKPMIAAMVDDLRRRREDASREWSE